MPDSVVRYDVFLSHNSADKAAVEAIARQLMATGIQAFLDKWYLIPGTPWQEGIEEALAASTTTAVFIGPSGISPWHNEEMRDALDRAVRSRDDYRVIPVLLPGASENSASRFLARRVWVDFRAGLDDAEALERLCAGIRGEAIDPGAYRLPDEPAPYRGLLRFEAEHARFFFGRDADTKRLIEKVNRQPFVAVVGASGCGKSSLVRAGLLPALARDTLPGSRDWQVLTFTPGSQPLRSLANQLAAFVRTPDRPDAADKLAGRLADRPDGLRTTLTAFLADRSRPVLLFIDQFEELFTLCADGPERCRMEAEQFIANLADAAERGDSQIRIVLTLRADFLDRCLAFPDLCKLLEDRQLLLGPLTQADLRDAIVRPAQQVGAFLEKGLVNTILTGVGDEPGNLPLLQHALHELWLARRGPWLTLDAYETSGGVRGALGRRAQDTYDALTPEQQTIARAILLRLTALGEGVSDTRRRAERTELYPTGTDPAQVDTVIQALSGPDARLVVADANSVEVAHEALIQGWSALRGWLEESRETLRTHRRLTDAANEWGRDRDESYLYRGVRLAEAEGWIAAHGREMNALEADFVKASLALRDNEAMEREAIRQRELEQQRALVQEQQRRADAQTRAAGQLRRLATYLAAALLFAIVAAIGAGAFYKGARDAQTQAERDARRAKAGELATSALLELGKPVPDPSLALILAREAVTMTHSRDGYVVLNAGHALDEVVRQAPPWLHTLAGHTAWVASAVFSPDGQRVLTAGTDGTARLWDAASGQLLATLVAHTDAVFTAAFSPDGRRVLTAGTDNTARVWDASGRLLVTLAGHTAWVVSAAYSPDGQQVLTRSADNTARVWDAASGRLLATLAGHTGPIYSAVFSPDGQRVLTASFDKTACLWDAASGRLLTTLAGHIWGVNSGAFSPDGQRVVTSSNDNTARVWDAVSGRLLATLEGHTDPVNSAAFSPDGQRVLTASDDRTARMWDAASGRVLTALAGHMARVISAAFSRDGQQIVTASSDNTARLWDAASGQLLTTLTGHTSWVNSAAFSPDGQRVVTASWDNTARLWGTTSRGSNTTLTGHKDPVTSATFSPNGQRVLTASFDKTARLWNAASGQLLATLAGHKSGINVATFSPNGQWALTASNDRTARLWDATSDQLLTTLAGHTDRVNSAAFSPDDQRVVTASWDNTARLWDAASGRLLATLAGHTKVVYSAAFSPDGQRVLTASADNTARLWDATSGRLLTTLTGHRDSVTSAAFSPDGRRVLTASWDNTARLWDAGSGRLLFTLAGHTAWVYSAVFSPDGQRLLTASRDTTARVWDVASGRLLCTLDGHTAGVISVAFSPDGQWVVTASADNTARVWDAASGRLLYTLAGHTKAVRSAAFSPDGQWVITASDDNTARTWYTNIEDLLAAAEQLIQRDPPILTPKERQQYGLE